ncbi:sulfur carrier protein ThiS [Weissella ceti]|uniref:Sulfur carrier protein ThiS n=1 Tax=Weissella ceti TaxID=759620 RepID=A0ABT3E407_9LACO|nr:sulfur carrier protein ThiS [Weissella ceti]MCW0953153.1 sulfur carrier protein ThiS [Weissella ceti]QVK12673.1 sulfur carrier protein ThiS [Weissella ceti]
MRMNGQLITGLEGLTVSEMLKKREVMNTTHVVVELNGRILKEDDFQDVVLGENDAIEVVSFVGGG